ncbi:MAG: ATP-binding protein [Gammaproteobacteria bacterium]
MSSSLDKTPPFWLFLLVYALAYYITYKLDLNHRIDPRENDLICVASGLYLAALFLSPYKKWAYFTIISIAIRFLFELNGTSNKTEIVAGFHMAEIVEAILTVWLVRKFIGEYLNLSKLQHVLIFVGTIFTVSAIGGLISANFTVNIDQEISYWSNWQIWSIADVLGLLVVAPVIVSFTHNMRMVSEFSLSKFVEILILLSSFVLLPNFIFQYQEYNHHLLIALPYTLILLLLWAALRFNTLTVTIVLSLCIILVTTHHEDGLLSLSGISSNQQTLSVQIFISTLAFLTLVLSANSSERRSLSDRLVDSEERYRSFIRNSKDGIWRLEFNTGININLSVEKQIALIKQEGIFKGENNGLKNIFSFTPSRDLEKLNFESIFPASNEKNQMLLERFIKSGYRTNNDIAYSTNSKNKDLHLSTSMVGIVEDDYLIRIWGTESDITDQIIARETLQRKEQLTRLITNLSTRFINVQSYEVDAAILNALKKITEFVGDEHSEILIFSEDHNQVEKVYEWCANGVKPKRSILKNISKENHPWLVEQFIQLNVIQVKSLNELAPEAQPVKELYQSLEIKSTIDVPLTLRGKFVGTLGFDSLSKEKSWDDDNIALLRIIGEIFVNAIDKKKADRALIKAKDKFYKAFHASPDVIVFTSLNKSGNIIAINNNALKTFGYSEEDLVGRDILDIKIWESSKARDVLLEKVKRQIKVTNHITDLRSKDGTLMTFSISCVAIEIQTEKGMMFIARDITKQKQLEKITRDQELQLLQADKMSSLGLMVSGMAHEVNNPNNLIQINSTLLGDMWPDVRRMLDEHVKNSDQPEIKLAGLPYEEMRETIPELIDSIHNGSKRIQSIVENLKNFSRRGDKQEFEKVDLNNIVRLACSLIRPQINKKTNLLALTLSEGLPFINGHSQQLEQVIINLVINALDSLTSRNQNVIIKTNYNRVTNRVELHILDQGCGISSKDLPFIFDPFFTTKLDDGGTGLGLAVSYNLIKAHGGTLTVKSHFSSGTEFLISLPRN